MQLFVFQLESTNTTYCSAIACVMAENKELARLAVEEKLAIKGDWKIIEIDHPEYQPVYNELEPHIEEFYI